MDAFFTLTPDGIIDSCNHNFVKQLFGYSAAELEGKHITYLIPDLIGPEGPEVTNTASEMYYFNTSERLSSGEQGSNESFQSIPNELTQDKNHKNQPKSATSKSYKTHPKNDKHTTSKSDQYKTPTSEKFTTPISTNQTKPRAEIQLTTKSLEKGNLEPHLISNPTKTQTESPLPSTVPSKNASKGNKNTNTQNTARLSTDDFTRSSQNLYNQAEIQDTKFELAREEGQNRIDFRSLIGTCLSQPTRKVLRHKDGKAFVLQLAISHSTKNK